MKLAPCNYRHPVDGQGHVSYCTHPRIVVPGDRVSHELCRVCPERLTDAPPRLLRSGAPTVVAGQHRKTVAVVIPCHNYGRFLGEAIESVLAQTRAPEELLVVDDASSDDTASVARRYIDRGVGYLRVNERHSQLARRAGWLATRSDVLCFLDADDALAPDYLAAGLDAFDDVRVGIVYSDVEYFGDRCGRSNYPAAFDRARLARMNYLHTGSLVRREALDISRAFAHLNDDRLSLQDWLLWRLVADYGWLARKQKGLYRYRRHPRLMTALRSQPNCHYFERASLAREVVTLFVPLSGREPLWPEMADFLDRQTWPHAQTRLVLFDTSQNHGFSRQVRKWIADCDYPDVRHWIESVGEAGLADRPRLEAARDVTLAMTRIYNRLARDVTTDYVWIVEDDIVPPDDACRRLLRGFDQQTASVSGVYRSRFAEGYVAWRRRRHIAERGEGVEQVDGNGFGCVVLRGEVVRGTVFTATIDCPAYDTAFYHRLPLTGLKAKVDWSVECQHRFVERAAPTRDASEAVTATRSVSQEAEALGDGR